MDKQLDNFSEVVSISKSLSKQKFILKILVLIFFFFDVFMVFKWFI